MAKDHIAAIAEGDVAAITAAQGEQTAAVSGLAEAADPKGTTVTADVVFAGNNSVKVRHAMFYTDGKLSDEIWQVDPDGKF